MKRFNGFDEAKSQAKSIGVGRLPAGGYICKVMDVKYMEGQGDNSDQIKIMFDIEEGDFKGYFKKKYEANTNEDKKWPGTASIWVPKDDGSEKDGWTKNAFARWTNAFEESNKGYVWDWDEKKWKNKVIGIAFGETGTVINGKEILYTEARHAESTESIKADTYYHEKFKAKNGYNGNQQATSDNKDDFLDVPAGTDEKIPF